LRHLIRSASQKFYKIKSLFVSVKSRARSLAQRQAIPTVYEFKNLKKKKNPVLKIPCRIPEVTGSNVGEILRQISRP